MQGMLHQIASSVRKAGGYATDATDDVKARLQDQLGQFAKYNDLTIQFIGASGLPRMDVVGSADPYFVAKIDDKISFTSSVQTNTLSPVWNEIWKVNRVPSHASLVVKVFDKDEGITDDYIGQFTTSVNGGARECGMDGKLGMSRGTFWIKIDAVPCHNPHSPPYTFDGPVRYSVHRSPVIGHLTALNNERLYSTWKMHLKGVPNFFGDMYQHWNTKYKAAQSIFNPGPSGIALRSTIQAAHRMLYARSTTNGFGVIDSSADTYALLKGGKGVAGHRIKPAVYTYIVASDDDTFRFSETGAAFFVDFASKHALHSNCAETVRYSGEFHPRPSGGWEQFREETPDNAVEWELVIDNNSGTYSPDSKMLPALRLLLEYNFPGFAIVALDHEDSQLIKSRDDCRAYALNNRGIQRSELQPTLGEGEEALFHRASLRLSTQER